MNRSLALALGLPLATLPLVMGACSSSSDDATSSTTTAAAQATSTTEAAVATTTTEAVSPSSSVATTSTTTAPAGCSSVTEAQVAAAAPNGGTIDNWACATDTSGGVWVGATASNQIDYNFILRGGAGGTWSAYDMANCTNPPVPAKVIGYCEAS